MKGKQYKYVLTFRRTPNAPTRVNKLYYDKKVDAEHDKKSMLKTEYYKNPRIRKL